MMRYQKSGFAAITLAAVLLSTGPVAAQLSQCAVQIGPRSVLPFAGAASSGQADAGERGG